MPFVLSGGARYLELCCWSCAHDEKYQLAGSSALWEVYPPMLARAISTIDHMLKGRLTINIISSNLPGEELDAAARYQRSREVIILS
ncbi:MAG: hypothetical protein R2865_15870 [Deinococcales bacterium]